MTPMCHVLLKWINLVYEWEWWSVAGKSGSDLRAARQIDVLDSNLQTVRGFFFHSISSFLFSLSLSPEGFVLANHRFTATADNHITSHLYWLPFSRSCNVWVCLQTLFVRAIEPSPSICPDCSLPPSGCASEDACASDAALSRRCPLFSGVETQ